MKARFDFKSGQLLKSDEEYFRDLLAQKQPYNEPLEEFDGNFNTVWYISNCNHSSHAVRRWEFGKTLIDAGLKVHGEGILINIIHLKTPLIGLFGTRSKNYFCFRLFRF